MLTVQSSKGVQKGNTLLSSLGFAKSRIFSSSSISQAPAISRHYSNLTQFECQMSRVLCSQGHQESLDIKKKKKAAFIIGRISSNISEDLFFFFSVLL